MMRFVFSVRVREKAFFTYFGNAQKLSSFGTAFVWLQSCKIISKEVNLQVDVALSLRSDNSKQKLQINFLFLLSKYFICLSKLKERIPRLDEFLPFVKLTYQIEKIDPQSKDKWKPHLPVLNS